MKHSFLTRTQKGFTLIELSMAIAVVAVIAATAIPAYLDYLIKPAITEAIAQMNLIIKGFQEEQACTTGDVLGEGRNYVRQIKMEKPAEGDIVVCKVFVYFSGSAFQCNEDLNCQRACPTDNNNCYLEYHFKETLSPNEDYFYGPMEIGWLDFFITPSYAVRVAGGVIAKTSTVASRYWPKS